MAIRKQPGIWRDNDRSFRRSERKAYMRHLEHELKSAGSKQQQPERPAATPQPAPHTSTRSQYQDEREKRISEIFATIFFIGLGIAAIILPFVWNFWFLFKVIFVGAGIFSLSIPFIVDKNQQP